MQIGDPQFWLGLNPGLHIEAPAEAGPIEVSAETAAAFRSLIRTEGYLHAEGLVLDRAFESLAGAVKTLAAKGLPAPFAFVYDEFWRPFHRLRNVIEQVLGRSCLMLPDFWVWHLSPEKAESGWRPHRDKGRKALFEDGTPMSLTVWLPLTAATPLNGCVYLVPADRDPTYGTEREGDWTFAMPDIRALPAKAGDLLMWNQAVLHWGAHASERAAEPRISMAFEFQRDDVKPFNQPLLAPDRAPGFDDRLRLVCKQVLQYRHIYKLSPEIQEMVDDILHDAARRRRA